MYNIYVKNKKIKVERGLAQKKENILQEKRIMAVSKAATTLSYTENELKAIEALKAANGEPKTASELGVPSAVLTTIRTKYNKFADQGAINVIAEDKEIEYVATKTVKAYRIAD